MPIRHCQKCGLKVLIDDSLMSINPFYCQRCAAVAKSPGDEAAPPPAAAPPNPSTTAAGSPAPAPPANVAKGSALKVVCPYCKAGFTGRVPAKPAKGACPVCHKDLILLPDGGIRPAQGFDLATWQKESAARAASPSASGEPPPAKPDPVQARLEPRGTKIVRMPPSIAVTSPPADDDLAEPPPDLGGETMLDMGRPAGRPAPAKPPASEADEAFPSDLGGETMLDMGRSGPAPAKPKPLPSEAEEAFPSELGGETMLDMGRGGAASGKPKPLPSEAEEAFPSELGGETMLDMGRGGAQPPKKNPATESEDAFPSGLGGETMLDMGRSGAQSPVAPALADEAQEAFPQATPRETLLDLSGVPRGPVAPPPPPRPIAPPPTFQEPEDTAPPPPPPEEPAPAPAPEMAPLPPPPKVEDRPIAPATGRSSKAKPVAAYILLILPILIGIALTLVDEPGIQDLLGRVRTVSVKGFFVLRSKVTGAAIPADLPVPSPEPTVEPTPEPTPTPTPTPTATATPTPVPVPTGDEIQRLKKDLQNQMTDLFLSIKKLDRQIRSLDKDPTEDQKKLMGTMKAERDGKQKKFAEFQKMHVDTFGSEFKPEEQ